ncbi:uncharacterized protein LOC100367885 [Saccoglossus kowalevskii]|uniref:Uncharacterized protein LOC100367885 n=1 Tax=Saccoglossus kowalevskii TaxID=10224 RepID=A0ABM0GTD8_SACKO|nr:PREDICTED: uncharacterized protein LOC100367885 [Saccoglossus kowalevskii]
MSSHASCFQTEKSIYPPVVNREAKGHGVVSSYEKHLLLHDFVIPLVQDQEDSDPQPLPTQHIPTPIQCAPAPTNVMGDPDLCLSPERPVKKVSISPGKPTVHKFQAADPVHEPGLSNGNSKQLRKCSHYRGVDIDVRPLTAKSVVSKKEPSQSSIALKENKQYLGNRITTDDRECELTKPVYHSTVALGQQLQTLKENRFDPQSAVMKVLQYSEETHHALSERVAETVNVPVREKKYSGLISVDVPIEETVSHVIEEKMSKVKIRPDKKPKEAEPAAPDILEFFTPDLQEETAHWCKPAKLSVPLELAPDTMVFDLYRHMQWWEQH